MIEESTVSNVLVRAMAVGFCLSTSVVTAENEPQIRFKKHQLDARFRSEGDGVRAIAKIDQVLESDAQVAMILIDCGEPDDEAPTRR